MSRSSRCRSCGLEIRFVAHPDRLAEVAATNEHVVEPADAGERVLLNRYCAVFEDADVGALTELLLADIWREIQSFPA